MGPRRLLIEPARKIIQVVRVCFFREGLGHRREPVGGGLHRFSGGLGLREGDPGTLEFHRILLIEVIVAEVGEKMQLERTAAQSNLSVNGYFHFLPTSPVTSMVSAQGSRITVNTGAS